jgi:protein-S-isoprenylcysteine O-methyltransferase Ste14
LSLLRSAVLVGNLAVVLYMLYVIRANRRERRLAASLGASG